MKQKANNSDGTESTRLTIAQAAKIAKVSTATIRNWIKTGFLIQSAKACVSRESLDKFMREVAGKEKLNARANKLLKDEHDHKIVSDRVNTLIHNYKDEEIGSEYENLLSNSYRNKEGVYYTPSWIVKDLFKNIKISSDDKFLDPCCGSGNFIIEAIRCGVSPENVFGFDTDENAVLITKQRIKAEFGYDTDNVRVGDFLKEARRLSKNNISFDLIFTNPPWGKKIEKSEKERFAALYGCGNSLDTTSLFLGAAFSVLKPNGFLGFLIQEAFFNITTYEDIRRNVLTKKIIRFSDYGKAFKGLLTKAQAVVLKNCASDSNDIIECHAGNNVFNRTSASFEENPKHIFNFWADEHEAQVIRHLYSIRHITLRDRASWALGIITGNNGRFCSYEQGKGYVPIFRGADITKSGLKSPCKFIISDFSKFQQVAPLERYHAKEKLIYKFISFDLCFYCDTKQRYILNSANLLIPNDLSITTQQLSMLLNSEIINWLFKKMFATHKVLRGDLELLPIHSGYFLENTKFTEKKYLDYLKIIKTEDGEYQVK